MASFVALIDLIARLYQIVLLARVLLSWVQVDPYHPAVQFLYQITEPVLRPIRQIVPPTAMGLDFSPLIAMVLVEVLASIIGATFS